VGHILGDHSNLSKFDELSVLWAVNVFLCVLDTCFKNMYEIISNLDTEEPVVEQA